MARWAAAVCACALCGAFVATARAEENERRGYPPVEIVGPGDAAAPAREKIRHELEVQSQIDITDVELPDIVLYLSDFHHIQIDIDGPALDEAAFDWHQTSTAQLERIPLHSLLDTVLGPIGCGFMIHDDHLLITTAGKAARARELMIYPVGDLVGSPDAPPTGADFEPLVEAVRSLVVAKPLAAGAPAPVVIAIPGASALVVVHNDSMQRQVAKLLDKLRAARFLEVERRKREVIK